MKSLRKYIVILAVCLAVDFVPAQTQNRSFIEPPLVNGRCFKNGTCVEFMCIIDMPEADSLVWSGSTSAFDCEGSSTATTHRITLGFNPQRTVEDNCGSNLFATLALMEGSSTQYQSILSVNIDYETMNGSVIECSVGTTIIGQAQLVIGVTLPPPQKLSLEFPEAAVCDLSWQPPSIDGTEIEVEGFNLTFIGTCGDCSPPSGFVLPNVTDARCVGWIPMGQTCTFEIRAISDDCGLFSPIAEFSVVLDNTPPEITAAHLVCSKSLSEPGLEIQWTVSLPKLVNVTLPTLLDFRMDITGDSSIMISENASKDVRSYTFSDAVRLSPGSYIADVYHRNDANRNGTPSTTPATINILQIQSELSSEAGYACISITIGHMPLCRECAYSFEVEILYRNGTCSDGLQADFVPGPRVPFNNDYTVCASIPTNIDFHQTSVCYMGLIYNNSDTVVATIEEHNIELSQCDLAQISQLNSALTRHMGNAFHNEPIRLSCADQSSTLVNGEGTTRCINGMFVPQVTEIQCLSSCIYSYAREKQDFQGATGSGWAITILAIIIIIIIIIGLVYRRTRGNRQENVLNLN